MIITQKRSENLVYILIWAIVLSLPIFTLKGGNQFNWNRVFSEWIRLLPFLLIFLINNSILAPALLFRRKLLLYFLSITTIIILFSTLFDLSRILHDLFIQINSPHQGPEIPGMRGDPPPHLPEQFQGPPNFGPPNNINKKPASSFIMENTLIAFLVVGFNNAIKFGIRRQNEELQREEKEKIHLKTELSFLRQQISPHFFMNTLNNIHALIEMDQVQAQKSVIELSKLMRYLLNESQEGTATIKDEFEFLTSYIDLMRIRYSKKVKIDINFDIKEDHRKIPSLLFISLVENAFKYGISYSQNSFISIKAKQENENLQFEIKNSISHQSKTEKGTGIGLINLQKQLGILFEQQHTFEINENEKEYHVKLIIPLEND